MSDQTTTATATQPEEVKVAVLPPLTIEERSDLRRRVLQGYKMTVEEARRVFDTLRTNQGGAIIAGEEKKSKKKGSGKSMSDADLNKDLDQALGL